MAVPVAVVMVEPAVKVVVPEGANQTLFAASPVLFIATVAPPFTVVSEVKIVVFAGAVLSKVTELESVVEVTEVAELSAVSLKAMLNDTTPCVSSAVIVYEAVQSDSEPDTSAELPAIVTT
ncbi:MAG: hypothetical protein WC300_03315, partial [Candidatus Omnitrophota bacterium]